MTIYENNKELLTAIGGDSLNLSTDFEVRKAILEQLGGDSTNCSSIYEVDLEILKIYQEGGGGTGGGKSKVSAFSLNTSCLDENGFWDGNGLDISLITSLNQRFTSLKPQSLDLSSWNTENVTDMSNMFSSCSNLKTIGSTSNWDTSEVTAMDAMFYYCSSLQSLDISGWYVSNITNMSYMFYHCSSLQSLDISGWDVSNVTNMDAMFFWCSSLQSLDISGWDVSNVTNMSGIFTENRELKTLVGDKNIDEVISNNISIFKGLNVNLNIVHNNLNHASLRALINGLADLTGSSSKTLNLSSTSKAKLTDEDIAIATAKNWTIA